MRVLQVGYAQTRRWGKPRVSTEHKLHNGLVRCGHNVLHFSDRDVAAFLAPFGLRDLGRGKANRKLLEVAHNFQPEFVLLGHCDIIRNRTISEIRKLAAGVRIAYRNVDPLFVPDNVEAIQRRTDVVDAIFCTTAGKELDRFKGRRASVHFIPNPTDPAIECLNNAEREDLGIDLFFCGNSNEHTDRKDTVVALKDALASSDVVFKAFGYFGEPNVWGRDYDAVLAQSRMGLNLNRQEGFFLYSSARIAQLMGNGIVALVHRASGLERLLGAEAAVFFDDVPELTGRIRELKEDDDLRRRIGAKGRNLYRRCFSSDKVAQYIVERTMGLPPRGDFMWAGFE